MDTEPTNAPAAIARGEVSAPLLVFDGDCGFCRAWVDYWKHLTRDAVAYAPFQEAAARFPSIPREEFAHAVQLILPDGEVRRGAQAAFTVLALGGRKNWLRTYQHVPAAAPISEAVYGVVARHRSAAYRLTQLLWGIPLRPESNALARWLFLRALGLIYLIAFVSFGMQASGLIGSQGVLPVSEFLPYVRQYYHAAAYWMVPTFLWINAGDIFLKTLWIAGAGFALLLLAGVNQRFPRLVLYLLYLSLVAGGQIFMGFQWDALLLETGFLAIFLSDAPLMTWLYRWLLFRLMLLSGAVKLLSGDPTWREFRALQYHYQTQPLPTPLAWYAQQLPAWFQHLSVGVMFAIELGAPFLLLLPRRPRAIAALAIAFLQLCILLTGNYTFFNLLTLALCLFLLDDAMLARLVPARFRARIEQSMRRRADFPWRKPLMAALAVFVLVTGASQLLAEFFHADPAPLAAVERVISPFELVNRYGLFAVMTTRRMEIVIQGSNDGQNWQDYEFKYKPGDVYRRPPMIEPLQPRLDWQMWFAALGNYQENPWVLNLMVRLMQQKQPVVRLLARDPFPQTPPHFMRALLYEYRFTTLAERRATGAWWSRELRGAYTPTISLRQ